MDMNHKIHENEIFRFFHCRLSIEKTSLICDVNQKTVKGWDAGKPIPEYYRKLMSIYGCHDLSHIGWAGWQFEHGYLRTPLGYKITPEQIEYWYIMHSPNVEKRQSELEKLRRSRKWKGL